MIREDDKINIKFSLAKILQNSSYYHRLETLPISPMIYQIEPTSRCNLDCIMCPRKEMKRNKEDMKKELFKKIINQCKKYTQTKFLWLHHFGEPLLHPEIDEFINITKNNGINVGISSNGVLLDERMSKKILRSKLDYLVISFDGPNKKIYEKMRKGASFEKTKNNILNFLKTKRKLKKSRPFTEIQMIATKETKKYKKEFKEKWKKFADIVVIKEFKTWNGSVQSINEMDPSPPPSPIKNPEPCEWPWTKLVILYNGDVVPCCYDYQGDYILGNIKNSSLLEIWNNEKMIELRRDLKSKRKNKLCKNCPEQWKQGNMFYPISLEFITDAFNIIIENYNKFNRPKTFKRVNKNPLIKKIINFVR